MPSSLLGALVLTLSLLAGPPPAAPKPAQPQGAWMTHKVERGETLASVAARWGVTEEDLVKWNPWVGAAGGALRPKKILQLRATRRPALRMRAIFHTGAQDTWASVAERVGMSESLLKSLNAEHADESLRPGLALIAVRDTERPGWNPYADRRGPEPEAIVIPRGGLSHGRPNGGHLVNGVKLPQTDLYDLWKPEQCYGSTHAVEVVVDAIGIFRRDTAWTGRLTIGSMSREGGGHFPPHKSHRTGRDVDIRLPRLDGSGAHSKHDEVDWHATWALVRAFIDTGKTEVIFLSRRLHPLLRRAAKDMGATPEQLRDIGSVVVHAKGHHSHVHVRIGCGIDETDCTGVVPTRAAGQGPARDGDVSPSARR